MNALIQQILLKLPPEFAHAIALNGLSALHTLHLLPRLNHPSKSVQAFGCTFPNPIGLAAGLDKNGDYIDALLSLGFGFIEIGTVTPRPQAGNPKPRVFRLPEDRAIINRMGFNNKGMNYVLATLQRRKSDGVVGVNIGKNKDTPPDKAIEDYVLGFRQFSALADYITLNISSPNTPGLRDLQTPEQCYALLTRLKQEQADAKRHVPLLVKIAPDFEAASIAEILLETKIDGVIATNTTISRPALINTAYANETGGLSGAPLTTLSTHTLKTLSDKLENNIPLIAAGGIMNEADLAEKQKAGATLFQVYTGFIYEGPTLITRLINAIQP